MLAGRMNAANRSRRDAVIDNSGSVARTRRGNCAYKHAADEVKYALDIAQYAARLTWSAIKSLAACLGKSWIAGAVCERFRVETGGCRTRRTAAPTSLKDCVGTL